ncbi:BrnA antitoxin family protein [Desulfonema magnum]
MNNTHSGVTVTVELDENLLQWFKAESEDWEAQIQTALRLYVETFA